MSRALLLLVVALPVVASACGSTELDTGADAHAAAAIRDDAARGYGLAIAPAFPTIRCLRNVSAYTAAAEEGGNVNGVLAAEWTGSFTIGAIDVARANGVLWFGTQSDPSPLAPELVVTGYAVAANARADAAIEGIERGTIEPLGSRSP